VTWQRLCALVAASTSALTAGCSPPARSGPAVPDTPPIVAPVALDTVRTAAPFIEMACSETKLRTPIAMIRMRPSRAVLDSTVLEVAVAKDGFVTGRFASLHLTPRTRRVAISVSPEIRRQAPTAFAFETMQVDTKGDSAIVVIEKLEPGVNYFWRVVEPGARTVAVSRPVRAQALTCTADGP
jgi:hypothetical protein